MNIFLQSYSFRTESEFSGLVMLFILIVAITVLALYLLTLQNTLKAISPENRRMPPGNVWLMLIPFFGLIWHFIIVTKMADSIKAQFESRGVAIAERPGFGIGLAACILNCGNLIPVLNVVVTIPGLICWIIYWVKISGYKKQIESLPDVIDENSQIFGSKY